MLCGSSLSDNDYQLYVLQRSRRETCKGRGLNESLIVYYCICMELLKTKHLYLVEGGHQIIFIN